jgi:hypothetical protein
LLVIFANPYPEALACPSIPKVLQTKKCTPIFHSSVVFSLDSHLSLLRNLRVCHIPSCQPLIFNILSYNLTYLPTDLLFSTYCHTTLLTYLLFPTYHPTSLPTSYFRPTILKLHLPTSYFRPTIIKPYLLPSTFHLPLTSLLPSKIPTYLPLKDYKLPIYLSLYLPNIKQPTY